MKFVTTLLAALISTAAAAPAIVWTGENGGAVKHSSELIDATTVVSSVVAGSKDTNVIFVVARTLTGSEGLTGLTTSGALPKLASKYPEATAVHHYVRGIESFDALLKHSNASSDNVVETSLKEFQNRATTNADKASVAADGSVANAPELIIVTVGNNASPAEIDAAVTSAIEDPKVGSVVLTAVRGVSEVKLERDVNAKMNYYEMNQKNDRRRLEDGQQQDGQYYSSTDGIYFVNQTPNIFTGLMFFFFFIMVTYVGIGCMDMIAGQEVYVTKYPVIGREA
jgi:hypothetical protein